MSIRETQLEELLDMCRQDEETLVWILKTHMSKYTNEELNQDYINDEFGYGRFTIGEHCHDIGGID